MKFNIVQIVDKSNVSHLVHDPIRLLLYTLEDLGHDVILSKNNFSKDRINIVVIGARLTDQNVDALIASRIPYVVYQTEIFSDQGLNYQSNFANCMDIQDVYIKLVRHAIMNWEIFDFNQQYLQQLGIESHILHHGYHPLLEGRPKKETQDIDVAFFGTMTLYRQKILKELVKQGISMMVLEHDGPLFRDEILRRSKINLSIRSNDTNMAHLPPIRVMTGLYNHTMTVSDEIRGQHWMGNMFDFVEPALIVSRLQELLASQEYTTLAQQYRNEFLRYPMEDCMRPLLVELSGRVS